MDFETFKKIVASHVEGGYFQESTDHQGYEEGRLYYQWTDHGGSGGIAYDSFDNPPWVTSNIKTATSGRGDTLEDALTNEVMNYERDLIEYLKRA